MQTARLRPEQIFTMFLEATVIKKSISELIDGNDLSMEEAMGVMEIIMSGDATAAQISAFITALRFKGRLQKK